VLRDEGLEAIAKAFKRRCLTSLDLSGSRKFTNEALLKLLGVS
jgi:hypothetical protein